MQVLIFTVHKAINIDGVCNRVCLEDGLLLASGGSGGIHTHLVSRPGFCLELTLALD